MFKFKKILSLCMCFALVTSFASYADTVVIGLAPSSTDKSVNQNASNTTYLQNQYTGPGLLPSSSNYLGTSPIMGGVSYDNSLGQQAANLDTNGVAKGGPTTTKISSPASNNAVIAMSNGQSAIINNYADTHGTPASNTADMGPTTHEITAPKAGGEHSGETAGVIINGQYVDGYGPGNSNAPSEAKSTDNNNIPSYTTSAGNAGSSAYQGYAIAMGDIIKYEAVDITAAKPSVSAASAVVLNATTRQIYFSKDGFGAYAPAALTNLVTANILLSYKGLDDNLVVSQSAVTGLESGASTAGLKAGDTIKVRDAIAAMFVKSCCDVANVVAENVSGSIPAFVGLMNQTIKNWGCIGTVFTNPTGLNDDNQKTNVYDMAIIMDKATQNVNLKTLLGITTYQLPATTTRKALTLYSKNSLLANGTSQYYKGITASRMGYTSKAKYTMASEVDYNGNRLIAIVLKANGSQFTDTTKLLNYAKVACVEAAARGVTTYTNEVTTTNATTTNQVSTAPVQTATLAAGDAQGVWQQDGTGWYFQKTDGTRANNEWIKQNGKMYCVDSTGYMVTGWREFSNGKLYYFDPTNGEFRYNTWVNTNNGAFYLQADGSLAKAEAGKKSNITTSVGTYTIDDTGKAIAKVN